MLAQHKQQLNKILIIIASLLIIANLVFLDVGLIIKPKKEEIMAPMENKVEKVDEVEEVEKGEESDCRAICQEEISKALATISATPQQTVKTIYQPAPAAKQPSTIYISLGGNISTTNGSWVYIGGAEGYFNKNDYLGAKKISWEAFLKIKDSNGQANARLYDATHQVVISASEINGGGDSYSLIASGPLNLIDGNNLYQVQLRSSTGYEAYLEGARIKIDY